MAFALRHQLSDAAVEDLLLLVDTLLPQNVIGASAHKFLKKFHYQQTEVVRNYYCPKCYITLSESENAVENLMLCSDCSTQYEKRNLVSENNFFYYLPVRSALEQFVNSNDYNIMLERKGFSDVNNGSYYDTLCHKGIIKKTDVTLQFNTDGVSLFQSSTYSLWPILLSINNLPQTLKRKYLLLCGLWFNKEKPDINLYFDSFVKEMNILNEQGLIRKANGKDESAIVVKFHLLVGVADSVARPTLQNISQYNGIYGCSFCLKKGIIVNTPKGGKTRVYVGTDIPALRNLNQHYRDANTVLSSVSLKSVHGVKGASVLSRIPNFDVTCCFSPDYMHCVLLGVAKTFVQAWFDTKNHAAVWYLGKTRTVMDEKMKLIAPPTEITRLPRSLTIMKKWKASEWRNFLLYYSYFLLTDVGWPSNYLVHWSSLIYAITIGLQPTINECSINSAKQAIHYFVENIESLYGSSYCTFNTHLLLHIPTWLEKFGALWASSCFPYEDFNGLLNKLFSNVTGLQQQISKRYIRFKKLDEMSAIIFEEDNSSSAPLSSVRGYKLFNHFFKFFRRGYKINQQQISSHNSETIVLTLSVRNLIEQKLQTNIEPVAIIRCFANINGMLCHSAEHSALQKRNNSYVQLSEGTYAYIKKILTVTDTFGKETIVMEAEQLVSCSSTLSKNALNKYLSKVYHIVEFSGRTIIISAESLRIKCIGLRIPMNRIMMVPLVNHLEKGW